MSQKVVLLDLENNLPTLTLLRELIQHYSTLYVFNCTGKFEFALDDVTEFASWVSSGQVVVLDIPETEHKEYEYAVLVGQLMALLAHGTQVEVISAMQSSDILLKMLQASDIEAKLIKVQPSSKAGLTTKTKFKLPSIATINQQPHLQLVKQYCDILAKMSGKPNTLDTLKNSISNILQVVPEKAQHLVSTLINLKIVKKVDQQISFRKKVLNQWLELNLEQTEVETPVLDQVISQLKSEQVPQAPLKVSVQTVQQDLFKNFAQIDPVQLIVARKLRELKNNKPKDIYELRDLLESLFPQADIRSLLKELIEKGYIYWNGHEVVYSHEMFLN